MNSKKAIELIKKMEGQQPWSDDATEYHQALTLAIAALETVSRLRKLIGEARHIMTWAAPILYGSRRIEMEEWLSKTTTNDKEPNQ